MTFTNGTREKLTGSRLADRVREISRNRKLRTRADIFDLLVGHGTYGRIQSVTKALNFINVPNRRRRQEFRDAKHDAVTLARFNAGRKSHYQKVGRAHKVNYTHATSLSHGGMKV